MIRTLAVAAALVASTLVTVPAAQAADRPLPRLHATHGSTAAVRDASGAQVLLRAVNVNQVGEYFQANPDLPPTVPLSEGDFRQIARLGFNSVRLIVSWSALEPTPGAFDEAYVARIRQAVRWAAAYDLYVVLDMHQDAYGIAVDTPDGVACPTGTRPNNGWDGAPAWATITDGESTCTPGEREQAPAVIHAWQHFYDDTPAEDGIGVQEHLVKTWGRLAADFARSSTVAGYDLLNEPGFGLDSLTNITTDLGAFYGRAIKAIRAAEKKAGGFSHIVFWEPSVLWSAGLSRSVPAPGFTRDKNLVFAPHIYAESLSSDSIPEGFAAARNVAQQHGVTVWGGEWGFWGDQEDRAGYVERYAAAEDAAVWGGAWWDWKQACGDPHVAQAPDGVPSPISGSLNQYSCPDQAELGIDPAFGDVLSRPTARAVPGTIIRLTSDGRTGKLRLAGVRTGGAKPCSLRVFVPKRFTDLKVSSRGITKLRTTTQLGNEVLRGCVADSFSLRLG